MTNPHESPKKDGVENEDAYTKSIQEAHKQELEELQENEEASKKSIQEAHKQELEELQENEEASKKLIKKAHETELAELKKDGGYTAEEISDELEKQFKEVEEGDGDIRGFKDHKWEYAPVIRTNAFTNEYNELLGAIKGVGSVYTSKFAREGERISVPEMEIISSSGHIIQISALSGFVQILNRGTIEKGRENEPTEEPWHLNIGPSGAVVSFPKANFALLENDSRHPSNWSAERIESYLLEKIIPLVEAKKEEHGSNKNEQK